MGQIFQRTYKAKDGTVRKCATWTIRYYRNGKAYQEPTEFTGFQKAQNLLKEREGDIAKGETVTATRPNIASMMPSGTSSLTTRTISGVRCRISSGGSEASVTVVRWERLIDINAKDVRAFTQVDSQLARRRLK
jgi:hypothetical protein